MSMSADLCVFGMTSIQYETFSVWIYGRDYGTAVIPSMLGGGNCDWRYNQHMLPAVFVSTQSWGNRWKFQIQVCEGLGKWLAQRFGPVCKRRNLHEYSPAFYFNY